MSDELEGGADRRSLAVTSLLAYTREQFGEPIALVCHPSNAGAVAPYAVMYGLELITSGHVGPLELRVRWAGAEGDAGGEAWQ
jgi:hypothetical protein